MRSITFTRDDGKQLTFGERPPFELSPQTLLPEARTISVSAISHSGVNGGLTLGLRYEKATATIVYNIRNVTPLMTYRRKLMEFFTPMNGDLTPRDYTMTVTESDGGQWEMRYGHVTGDPTTAPSYMLPIVAGGKLTLTFDDPLHYDISENFTQTLNPIGTLPMSGEIWTTSGASLSNGGYRWQYEGQTGSSSTLTNNAMIPINPVITIHGALTNPKLTNYSTGEEWEWIGVLADQSDIIIQQSGTTMNGAPLLTAIGNITLQPGDNILALTAVQDSSHTGSAVIQWNEAF